MNKNYYNELCTELGKIRGAVVYDIPIGDMYDSNPYVELAVITQENIQKAHQLIEQYGYEVIEEFESDGSDYPSYCIWFKKSKKIYRIKFISKTNENNRGYFQRKLKIGFKGVSVLCPEMAQIMDKVTLNKTLEFLKDQGEMPYYNFIIEEVQKNK